MKLRFTARALRQFSSIAQYISRDDPEAAVKVGRRIKNICTLLTKFPAIGRDGVRAGTRELTVPGLPYVIVHRLQADQIVVLAIYHSRQLRPGQPTS
jgi:plasmid stabilization system protein ParE